MTTTLGLCITEQTKKGKTMKKIETEKIYTYDGYKFASMDDVDEYIVKKIGGVEHYKEVDTDAGDFIYEFYKVKITRAEWKTTGQHGEFAFAIEPLLSTINVIAHTTLGKKTLNKMIKKLQDAVNHLEDPSV
jgi:hypothetical protein